MSAERADGPPRPFPMSLTVVGSIAFDSVRTPFGERERMLGGTAVHFSLAASFFTEVRPVGPVGDDFGDAEFEVLERRGVIVDDIERVEGGQLVLLARALRVRPQRRPHRGHPARRLRRLPAEALGALEGGGHRLPRQHPARAPAPGPRAVRRRALRRPGLDEPLDRDRAGTRCSRRSPRSTA